MLSVSELNYFLALGTVAMQFLAVALLVVYLMRKREGFTDIALSVGNFGLWSVFLISVAAATLTLVYEWMGFEPCPLCWWQRIFLYPQIILFGMALWRERYVASAIDFSIVLSMIGASIALYHHALQMLPGSGLPCPATGVSCAQRIFFEFGYITYPLMAVSVFSFLIVTLFLIRAQRAR